MLRETQRKSAPNFYDNNNNDDNNNNNNNNNKGVVRLLRLRILLGTTQHLRSSFLSY